MAGNVKELVSDTWQYATDVSTVIVTDRYVYANDPTSIEGYTVIRGGAWNGIFGALFETSRRDIVAGLGPTRTSSDPEDRRGATRIDISRRCVERKTTES